MRSKAKNGPIRRRQQLRKLPPTHTMRAMNGSSSNSSDRKPLAGRHILLGVTGGIAAYKTPDLVRRLIEYGADVQVVMTESARRFVTPLSLQAVSGHLVRDSLWDEAAELGMGHIELARWADLILIAPATANRIAQMARGEAGDLLSAITLATSASIMVAPAMNRLMWADAATRTNIETLSARNVMIAGPAEGQLAERESGPGRMLEPLEIRDLVTAHFGHGQLAGCRVLITAGPTREPIDPVRYITNRSSGRMGYAMAAACAGAGASVTLVSGPTALDAPMGADRINVETAAQMHEAVTARAGEHDIFIATAAVADYRPVEVARQKMKKSDSALSIALEPTQDILADVSASFDRLFTVGFAAETEDMEARARGKRERKGLDMLAGNFVGDGLAFDVADNSLYVCWQNGDTHLPNARKTELARQLVGLIADHYHRRQERNA